MPIYEYRCTKCGHQFEELSNSCCAPQPKCPKCQSQTEKMLSSFAANVSGDSGSGSDYGGGSCCSGAGCSCGG
jgi:putative FmdB family regulatory protein